VLLFSLITASLGPPEEQEEGVKWVAHPPQNLGREILHQPPPPLPERLHQQLKHLHYHLLLLLLSVPQIHPDPPYDHGNDEIFVLMTLVMDVILITAGIGTAAVAVAAGVVGMGMVGMGVGMAVLMEAMVVTTETLMEAAMAAVMGVALGVGMGTEATMAMDVMTQCLISLVCWQTETAFSTTFNIL